MATWQLGPFDNDDAVDWCGALEDTAPDQRTTFVRQTLEAAALVERALTPEDAARAIAAAATVLQSIAGTAPSNSAYAPRFLVGRDDIRATSQLRGLARRALDAVLAHDSAWRLGWAEDIEEEEAFGVIEELRMNLASAVSQPEPPTAPVDAASAASAPGIEAPGAHSDRPPVRPGD